jgi:DNA replication protein DnaC
MAPRTDEEVAARERDEKQRAGAALVAALAMKHGRRYGPQRCALAAFEIYHHNQKVAVESVAALLARIERVVAAGESIVFFGPVGTGKDYLLAALLYGAARAGHSVSWENGQEVFGGFRDRIDDKESDESVFRALCRPDVLGISDPIPPLGNLGAWDVGNLYRIIDRRYCNLKPTWVSLNASSAEEAEAKLSAPVFDRLRHNATLLPCFWPSYRERKKQQSASQAQATARCDQDETNAVAATHSPSFA